MSPNGNTTGFTIGTKPIPPIINPLSPAMTSNLTMWRRGDQGIVFVNLNRARAALKGQGNVTFLMDFPTGQQRTLPGLHTYYIVFNNSDLLGPAGKAMYAIFSATGLYTLSNEAILFALQHADDPSFHKLYFLYGDASSAASLTDYLLSDIHSGGSPTSGTQAATLNLEFDTIIPFGYSIDTASFKGFKDFALDTHGFPIGATTSFFWWSKSMSPTPPSWPYQPKDGSGGMIDTQRYGVSNTQPRRTVTVTVDPKDKITLTHKP
jgi:hypothetical protein